MKHFGNVCNVDGKSVDPVDIITFGAPCQDLSVAGKRSGMKHEVLGDNETTRSGLFFEAIRIIKEMRESTNGEYPKYAVYENVPGAFSSNKGHDFHAVLEALCSVCDDAVSIPEPYDSKRTKLVWNKAGEIVGDNYSVARRTLDAQYWGVPQRRKRIYLVADFTGRRAGEILFKPDSLRGHMPQSNEAGQGATTDAVGSVDGSVGGGLVLKERAGCEGGGKGALWSDKAFTLATSQDMSVVQECLGYDMYNQASTGDKTRTLKTPAGGDDLPVVCVLNDQGGSSINVESEDVSPTLRANSHQHEPVIAFSQNQREEVRDLGDKAGALAAEAGVHQQTYVAQPVIALQANGIDRADAARCNGCGWRENESYTLNTIDRHAVCYDARGNGDGNLSPTITGDHQNRITDYTAVAVFEPKSALEENWGEANVKNALRAGASKSSHAVVQETKPPRKYIIRRLTPTECQRLQGFPNIVEVDMTDITRDELVAIALSAGYIKVNIASGEVFATRGPGGMERDTPVLLSGANVNGYKVYSLHANGVKKQIRANRLVWIAAHGAIPDGMVVDHINNDKQDNRVSNLQLLTAGQNSAKAHDDGCYLVGDDNPNCKIKECERKTISFLYWHTNMPYRILAEHFGISHSRAQQIIHEYEWGHLAPYNPTDAEFWESVRKTYAEINGKTYKPTKNIKGWYDKLHNDGAEYKMWGNGIALPNAEYVIHGIAEQGAKTLGSLFDGSGGFPLAGVMNGIKPLWASEVEPFPIAVTKSRFKEVHNG